MVPCYDFTVSSWQATCRVASTPERERRIFKLGWTGTTCWMTPKMQLEAPLRQLLTLAGDRTCLSKFFFGVGKHLQRTPSSISIGTGGGRVQIALQREKLALKRRVSSSHVFSVEQSLHHVTLTPPSLLFPGIVSTCRLCAGTKQWEKRAR